MTNQSFDAGTVSHVMTHPIDLVKADHDTEPLVVTGRFTNRPIALGFFNHNREADLTSMNVHG